MSSLWKGFSWTLLRSGVWRGFCFRPWTLKIAERSRKSWQRALLFSAPSYGMHQTLVQRRSDLSRAGPAPHVTDLDCSHFNLHRCWHPNKPTVELQGWSLLAKHFKEYSVFAYNWKLLACNWASLLTIAFGLVCLQLELFCNWSFLAYNCCFFAYSEKLRLISTWTDCKQKTLELL